MIGEGSESKPKVIVEGDLSAKTNHEETSAKDVPSASNSTRRKSKKLQKSTIEVGESSPSTMDGTSPTVDHLPSAEPEVKSPNKTNSSAKSVIEPDTTSKLPPNLLLPSFRSTYQMKENPSILKQLTQLLLRTAQPSANHVFRLKDPHKIRKAIAIGVHGFFPATYLRPMIGQPTGTSLRFASLCAESIRRWADAHGCSGCEIEKVALEGEGKISERVENLWKLMLNWIDHIRSADLIILASHSQGVPVSIMLLEKLLDLGIITNARIGVCAMAGVALGPFPEYRSSILMGSAAELWEFGNPDSSNSQRFRSALKRVLDYGARITFVGSIDDQLVPMEASIAN